MCARTNTLGIYFEAREFDLLNDKNTNIFQFDIANALGALKQVFRVVIKVITARVMQLTYYRSTDVLSSLRNSF